MNKYSIGVLVILLLIFSLIMSCSKDKPTENGTASELVGIWERTQTTVDGVVSTPESDPLYKFYEDEEVITLRADGTCQWAGDYGVIESTWHTDGDKFVFQGEGGEVSIDYTIFNVTTLSLFFPSDNDINPDLVHIYVKI